MPVTSLRKACVRPPEVAKIKIKSKIKIKIKIKSYGCGYGCGQNHSLLQALQCSRGADRRIVSTGSKFAPICSCSTRRGALDCRPL